MSERAANEAVPDEGGRIFAREELGVFDGNNGAPAYIAINGIVYDVTGFQLLLDGRHHGVTPGNDVTDFFVHKANILRRLKVVGKLG
jgi:predicted heme/steroid binding protein